jgi:hypothetical protein
MKDKQTIAQFLNVKDFPFEIKDKNSKLIYREVSNGSWFKRECDDQGNRIRYEDSNGVIVDERPKPMIELTLEDIAEMKGVSVSQIRIKE